jgi:eukaryotic-like serine/threonine-protein kinase
VKVKNCNSLPFRVYMHQIFPVFTLFLFGLNSIIVYMSSNRFITSRIFLIHLGIAAAVLILLIFLTLKGLEIYTLHGESNPVPDFSGMSQPEAQKIARHHNLRIEIADSVFVEEMPPGVIVDQLPEAGHGVKQNRTIFLSVNSTLPEMVTVPQLTDISFRQAQVLIENSGLHVGRVNYRPSEFNNLVLEVQLESVRIRSGQKLPKGTNVDLIVGRAQGNALTVLPNLLGFTVDESKQVLAGEMLNSGVIIYDNSVLSAEDSISARVWRQRPNPKTSSAILMGSSIDLWVTVDSLKINNTFELVF